MYDDVQYETDDEIPSVTSDRPNVYNAFRQQTIAELNVALREAIDDDGVYVTMLTGAGDGFCARTSRKCRTGTRSYRG